MPRPLNVLFAEPPPARRVGGIETALHGLASALPVAGVAVQRSDAPDPAALASADLVHFHGIWEPTHLRLRRACRRIGKPFVVSPHGMLEDWAFRHRGWKKRPYFHLLERPSMRRSRAVLATSEDEAATLRRWFAADQVRVLPLGYQTENVPAHAAARDRLGWPADERVVLFLSRCHEKKGLHLLVDVLPEAVRGLPDRFHLVVVGDGERGYVAPLQAATHQWSGNCRATWVGACWTAAKWDYLSGADLMCLPSYSENFGLAVLESLLAGTPVLTTTATPWGALRGPLPVRLTEPAAPALATALREACGAPRPTAGERLITRHAAEEMFGWSRLAPRYADLYREFAPGA